nr:HlyD family efflux transporter periplasmic adaptor subunit [uncultured Eisenbergiella sp.]
MSELENKDTGSLEPRESVKEKKKREKTEAKEKKAQEKREAIMAGGTGKKKKKKIGWIIALALVVVIVGYSVVTSVIAKNTPMQINTIAATVGTIEETMSTSGTVSSEQSKTYYAPVGATISEMSIALGDEVAEGQQLVSFDTTDLETQKTKAALDASATSNGYKSSQYQSNKNQSEYNEATIGLPELKVLAEQQEQYVQGLKYELEDEQQVEKEKLQDWLGKLNQELETQNNKLAEQRDEETRKSIQEIIQNLNNSIRDTSNQLSDLNMSDEMKEKQRLIDAEQKKLEDMKEEISKREGKESSSEAGISDPYVKQQQADSAQSAQITASQAANELEKAKAGVIAEFPGIVTKIATVSTSKDATKGGGLLEGATVSEGTELFTIESNKQVKVGIEVTKYDLPKIAVGQQVDVTIAGSVYEGEVSKINKVAAANSQGTPVVGAEVHIKNPDDNIFLGVEAKLVIHTASAENVVTIPVEIVNADKQGEFCYVVEDGVVTMRRITTGISSDSMVEVKEGLKDGDQIVYDVTGTVMEGMKVMAVPMGGAAAGQAVPETGAAAGETEAVAETASEAGTQTAAGEGSSEEADGETETAESQAADGTLGSENE